MSLPKPTLEVGHVWWGFDQRRIGKEKELVAGINEYWTRQRGCVLSILFSDDLWLGGGANRRHWILKGLCRIFGLQRLQTSRRRRHEWVGQEFRGSKVCCNITYYKYKAKTTHDRGP